MALKFSDNFDERELLKEKNKKRYVDKKKTSDFDNFKTLKKIDKKGRKSKLNCRLTDYESEDWYE